jgi:hypothetical protein
MTAELLYCPSTNQYFPARQLAKPQSDCGAKGDFRVYLSFFHPLHRFHQEFVRLQKGNIAELLLVATPPGVSPECTLIRSFTHAWRASTVQQHRTGSAAFRLRSFLLNATHYFGGQL